MTVRKERLILVHHSGLGAVPKHTCAHDALPLSGSQEISSITVILNGIRLLFHQKEYLGNTPVVTTRNVTLMGASIELEL